MMAESDDAQNSRESFILEVSGDGENELSIGSREILPPKFSKSPPTAHQGESGNQTLQRTKKCSLQARFRPCEPWHNMLGFLTNSSHTGKVAIRKPWL